MHIDPKRRASKFLSFTLALLVAFCALPSGTAAKEKTAGQNDGSSRVSASSSSPSGIEPQIDDGPLEMFLPLGYEPAVTEPFKISGTKPITVTLSEDHGGKFTWSDDESALRIGSGLDLGYYTTDITAKNDEGTSGSQIFRLTVQPALAFTTEPAFYLNSGTNLVFKTDEASELDGYYFDAVRFINLDEADPRYAHAFDDEEGVTYDETTGRLTVPYSVLTAADAEYDSIVFKEGSFRARITFQKQSSARAADAPTYEYLVDFKIENSRGAETPAGAAEESPGSVMIRQPLDILGYDSKNGPVVVRRGSDQKLEDVGLVSGTVDLDEFLYLPEEVTPGEYREMYEEDSFPVKAHETKDGQPMMEWLDEDISVGYEWKLIIRELDFSLAVQGPPSLNTNTPIPNAKAKTEMYRLQLEDGVYMLDEALLPVIIVEPIPQLRELVITPSAIDGPALYTLEGEQMTRTVARPETGGDEEKDKTFNIRDKLVVFNAGTNNGFGYKIDVKSGEQFIAFDNASPSLGYTGEYFEENAFLSVQDDTTNLLLRGSSHIEAKGTSPAVEVAGGAELRVSDKTGTLKFITSGKDDANGYLIAKGAEGAGFAADGKLEFADTAVYTGSSLGSAVSGNGDINVLNSVLIAHADTDKPAVSADTRQYGKFNVTDSEVYVTGLGKNPGEAVDGSYSLVLSSEEERERNNQWLTDLIDSINKGRTGGGNQDLYGNLTGNETPVIDIIYEIDEKKKEWLEMIETQPETSYRGPLVVNEKSDDDQYSGEVEYLPRLLITDDLLHFDPFNFFPAYKPFDHRQLVYHMIKGDDKALHQPPGIIKDFGTKHIRGRLAGLPARLTGVRRRCS